MCYHHYFYYLLSLFLLYYTTLLLPLLSRISRLVLTYRRNKSLRAQLCMDRVGVPGNRGLSKQLSQFGARRAAITGHRVHANMIHALLSVVTPAPLLNNPKGLEETIFKDGLEVCAVWFRQWSTNAQPPHPRPGWECPGQTFTCG